LDGVHAINYTTSEVVAPPEVEAKGGREV
nr:hypothetical protein [Tanacetum cinerariifolium]